MTGLLERGRFSYDAKAWADAYEALAAADVETALGAEDLGLLARASGLTGRLEEMLKYGERAFNAYLEAREYEPAALWAFWIGFRLVPTGEFARANGWFARAQRVLEREGKECVASGYLLLPESLRHAAEGNLDAAHDATLRAAAIGERFGDLDLQMLARQWQGRVLVRQGKISGLTVLDEVMLAAMAGELSPIVTGLVYCGAIAVGQRVCAFDRTRQWTSALSAFCEAQPDIVTFGGVCLVHRAEVMQLEGAWPEAVEEARRAVKRLSTTADPHAVGDAHYQEAEIHRLRGAFDEAEEGYREASRLGKDPQPGLSLLRLAQGQSEAALTGIRRALAATGDAADRLRLLPALAEIALARGEIEEARAAAVELEQAASAFGVEVLSAMAGHARGALQVAEGDAAGALPPLQSAFRIWQQVGAPYLAARVRVSVARACRALGDADGAALELAAAREVFERLAAAPDLATVDALMGKSTPPRGDHGLTARELEVLRLVAKGMTNKAIAGELFLSEKTVDRHVSNIFTKIDVGTRAAATAFAYQRRLV